MVFYMSYNWAKLGNFLHVIEGATLFEPMDLMFAITVGKQDLLSRTTGMMDF